MIREMRDDDGARVLEIYRMGLETRNSTFETNVPAWDDWNTKHLRHSRYVYEENGCVLGWVALSPVSVRKVYEGVNEVSIYIDAHYLGRGIGSLLMEKVVESSERNGVWTLCSGIMAENTASIKLHEKFGFRVLGTRERIAQLDGKWRNTVLMERRSKIVGL
jgi:L-amino acid N-acyltransferase YncA